MDSAASGGGSRKRQLSVTESDKAGDDERKRIRRRIEYDALDDCLPSPTVFTGNQDDFFSASPSVSASPLLTATSKISISAPSLTRTVSYPSLSALGGLGLIRRASSQSLASQYNDIDAVSDTSTHSNTKPKLPDISARYHLRNTKISIDYSPPSSGPGQMCVSGNNILYFTRGNRIHSKNLAQGDASDTIVQFYKPPASLGDISLLACPSTSGGHVAVSTANGSILLLDTTTKKRVSEWSTTKGVGAMRFNGNALLTIGTKEKGQIRCYDTRINPKSNSSIASISTSSSFISSSSSSASSSSSSTLKDKSSGVTRHQSPLTSLEWSPSSSLSHSSSDSGGRLLASGDSGGTIFIWDFRKGLKTPLDIGEYIQRNRKKIQHEGSVSSLAFCPWQPKILASADTKGTVRLWCVDPSVSESNAVIPGTIQNKGMAPVVGVAFSGTCKEFVVTYGGAPPQPESDATTSSAPPSTSSAYSTTQGDQPPTLVNSVAVYTYPGVRHVNTIHVPSLGPNTNGNLTSSVLTPSGMKLILSVPGEGKLKICDVWGKEKKQSSEVRRVSSFMGGIR